MSLHKLNTALKLCAHVDCVDNSKRYHELWDTFHPKLWKDNYEGIQFFIQKRHNSLTLIFVIIYIMTFSLCHTLIPLNKRSNGVMAKVTSIS